MDTLAPIAPVLVLAATTFSAAISRTSWSFRLVRAAVALAAVTVLIPGRLSQHWWRSDAVSIGAILVISMIASTVLAYAQRNLADDPRASTVSTLAGVVIASSMAVVTVNRLSTLMLAWLTLSVSTWLLLATRRDSGAASMRRLSARAMLAGDGLLAVLTLYVIGGHDSQLDRLASSTLMSSGTLAHRVVLASLAVGLVFAACARGGLRPFPTWVRTTVNAPTPISALLHAGVVNSGFFLLIRTADVWRSSSVAVVFLVGASLWTLWDMQRVIATHADVKGQLATSTVAQMSFMLLTVACGVPVLGWTHLIGHGLYKSARFLGAGGTVGSMAREAAAARCGVVLSNRARWIGVVAMSASIVSVGLTLWLLSGHISLVALSLVLAVAASTTWSLRVSHPTSKWTVVGLELLSTSVLYLGLATLLDLATSSVFVASERGAAGAAAFVVGCAVALTPWHQLRSASQKVNATRGSAQFRSTAEVR